MIPFDNKILLTFVLLISTGVISFFLVKYYRIYALRKSILDKPNVRSSHSIPTPSGGGIGIILSFYLMLAVMSLVREVESSLLLGLLPGLLLAVLGLIDDYKGLSARLRFIIQVLCAITGVLFVGAIDIFSVSYLDWLEVVLSVIGIVWFINLYNFLDGSNGYASMEAIIVGVAIWWFSGNFSILILAFSVLGFLYWNIPRARIFMGDSGSTTLGYIIVIFGIYLHNSQTMPFTFWLILTSLFWVDASITLLRRIIYKEKLNIAHKNHLYQRAIISGLSHMQLLLVTIIINIILFSLCHLMWIEKIASWLCILIIFCIHLFIIIVVEAKQNYQHKFQ